jgi:phage shock protein E
MRKLAYLLVFGFVVSACGATGVAEATGLRTVVASDAEAVIAAGGEDLVVLDIRTPEEFAEGHIDGALNIDFYAPDFADRLAELDPDARYVMYCRSDNRTGQTMPMLEELGFGDVAEVDGGVVAWAEAGLPLVP